MFRKMVEEKKAIANGRDLDISTRQAVEVCSWIKGERTEKAKMMLENVINKKVPVPYKRYLEGAGHKPGMGAGRYPWKCAKAILKIVKLAEANAANKGLSSQLFISAAVANKASIPIHYGRHGGRKMKRTHVFIEVKEYNEKEPKKKGKSIQGKSEVKND